jgi:hypothetical protein
MNPCFFLIRPPRAADGPLPPALWHRLGRVLLTLLAIYVAAMVLAAG